jgi:hypothetical protein
MDAEEDALERRKMPLLQEIAGIEVEQQRRRGVLKQVPHFSEIEDAGHKRGRFLSRLTPRRMGSRRDSGLSI